MFKNYRVGLWDGVGWGDGVVMVAHKILVSVQGPLIFWFWGLRFLGLRVWGQTKVCLKPLCNDHSCLV